MYIFNKKVYKSQSLKSDKNLIFVTIKIYKSKYNLTLPKIKQLF
jgi:hypothetical protein